MAPVIGTKRKRGEVESVQVNRPTVKHLALREIELEIAVKNRIAETVEARIAWALCLRESLQDESIVNDTVVGVDEFQHAALEALDAIERPCELILTREPFFASAGELNADNRATLSGFPHEAHPNPDDSLGQIQHSSRPSNTRHRIIRNPSSNVKLLFIRNTSISSEPRETSPSDESIMDVARIECPDCGRWNFSNLQGFLNHCRICHQREYGSHDECIRECSVLIASFEREWVLQNGTEITGVGIPSLRRLFEIAVGKKTSLFPTPQPEPSSDQDAFPIGHNEGAIVGGPEAEGTHLSRTLGVHQETPALAAVLGRQVARRQIRAFNEDEPVDIENNDDPPGQNRRWKMKFSHRNVARPELEVNLDVASMIRPEVSPSNCAIADGGNNRSKVVPDIGMLESTRFHITCRIMVIDRSRWLSPENRSHTHPGDTHSWIISIQSPSYGLDVTRALSRVTVICESDNPPKSLVEPLVVYGPPFVVESTTDVPFLAKVKLDWNGLENAPTVVEHWVQIDRLKTGYVTLGQEQLFDIELDRNTPLAPRRENNITW